MSRITRSVRLFFMGVSSISCLASVGRRYTDESHTAQMGAYPLASAKVTVPVHRNFDVLVMVDNLFDHNYQVLHGYPMPGVNAAGGVSIHF